MPVANPKRTSPWLALSLVLLAPQLGAAAEPAASQKSLDAAQASRGQLIYRRFCAVCHGPQGKGDGSLASGLRSKPTDLTRLAAGNAGVFPFEKVARAIDGRKTVRSHGPADMPVWGEVFAQTAGTEAKNPEAAVEQITHYVWSLQKPAAP